MTIDETIRKLTEMKLHTLAKSLREMLTMPPNKQLSFEEKLALLVDQEWLERENRKCSRRIKEARLSIRAAPDEIICDTARGLERAQLREPDDAALYAQSIGHQLYQLAQGINPRAA